MKSLVDALPVALGVTITVVSMIWDAAVAAANGARVLWAVFTRGRGGG